MNAHWSPSQGAPNEMRTRTADLQVRRVGDLTVSAYPQALRLSAANDRHAARKPFPLRMKRTWRSAVRVGLPCGRRSEVVFCMQTQRSCIMMHDGSITA